MLIRDRGGEILYVFRMLVVANSVLILIAQAPQLSFKRLLKTAAFRMCR